MLRGLFNLRVTTPLKNVPRISAKTFTVPSKYSPLSSDAEFKPPTTDSQSSPLVDRQTDQTDSDLTALARTCTQTNLDTDELFLQNREQTEDSMGPQPYTAHDRLAEKKTWISLLRSGRYVPHSHHLLWALACVMQKKGPLGADGWALLMDFSYNFLEHNLGIVGGSDC